jgi:hypothetical protein
MKRLLFVLALGAATQAAVPFARATVIDLHANLLGSNEVPATASPGTGFATIQLDTVAQTLALQITFSGLIGTTTASHIHCCLPSPSQAGVNVGVATTTPTFAGFPLGVQSGTYNSVLDLTLASSYNPAFVTSHGGLASAEAALIAGLLDGETYLNIHTTNFPGGEIRGFVVSEPGSLALLALGICAGFASLRRRRA